jgi:hypothetical protein
MAERFVTRMVARGWRQRLAGGIVVGLVAATLLSFGLPAQGAEATLSPSPTGYFTRTQDPLRTAGGQAGGVLCSVPSPDPRTCLNPAQLTGGTPQYPRKDNFVYVARIVGNDDARGTIAVPLFSLPFGAVINKLTLDFFVENEADSGSFNFTPDTPGLLFCLLTQGWAGQDGGAWAGQPFTDCSIQSLPKKLKEEERQETTEEGAPRMVSLVQYSVDLMPMAAAWAAGRENHGVMVLPTPDAPDTFEAAIRTPGIAADGMKINISYQAGESVIPPVDVPAADDAFGATGGGTSFGSTDTPAAEETPEAPFTVAAPETEAAPASATVSTPWWVYLALPLGGAVLGAMSRGVAQPVAANGVARRGPVSQLMDRRREPTGGSR